MDRWIDMAILLGVWLALQGWILPRLGVSTCMVPSARPSTRGAARGFGGQASTEEDRMADLGMRTTLAGSFDQTIDKVIDALKSEGFGVITDIDMKATLKSKLDVDFRRYRILGACNPPFAHKALSADLQVGLLLPCNVIVYEADDGRAVVSAIDPMQAIPAGEDQSLREIAQAVRDKLERVIAKLA